MILYEIDYVEKIVPDAYHGTSKEIAATILREGKFISSTGESQFLGDGVYFFESSKWHAVDWAKRKNVQRIGIIQATINLGRCIDLNNKDHRDFIRTVANSLKAASNGNKKITDALVINFIATKFENKVDTIRACYIQSDYKKIFNGSRFFDYSQLIICVRNLENIINFVFAHT